MTRLQQEDYVYELIVEERIKRNMCQKTGLPDGTTMLVPTATFFLGVEKTPKATEDFSESLVQQMVTFMEAEDKTVQTRYSENISGWDLTFHKTEEKRTKTIFQCASTRGK